ncbi:MAG: nitrilase-related carbon-nitrogen hydrolase [bacterium]
MRNVTIGLVQADTILGNVKANVEKGVELVAQASQKGAQIVVFPELFTTGYSLGQRHVSLAEKASGPSISAFCEAAKENGVYIQVGFAEARKIPGMIYNSLAFIDPEGKLLGSYAKTHLYAGERMHFCSGSDLPVYRTDYGVFAPLNCYDIGIPELSRIFALKGAECLLVSSAWCKEDEDIWDNNCIARSTDNLCYMAACNRVGWEEDLHLIGKSKFMAPRGHVISQAPVDEETILVETLDLDTLAEERHRCLYFLDRRPELYQPLVEL